MRRDVRHRFFAIVAILAMLLPLMLPPAVHADNSAQRHHTMTCSWSFNGDPYSIDMADLDVTISAKEKSALETVILNDEMREMAGLYHHDWTNSYPDPPVTVHKADMTGWHCAWTDNG